jgi:hypothetical protein
MDVYVANRADGVAGSGTQNDAFDGSGQAKFDAILRGIPIPATVVWSGSGTTATVTAINHGFSNGNQSDEKTDRAGDEGKRGV